MNVKLFTHTDLDGIGCAIVAFHKFGIGNVDVTYCDYDNVNEKVQQFLKEEDSIDQYDVVFITDISVDSETADIIEELGTTVVLKDDTSEMVDVSKFVLLDHHETAEWLNKYDWATVETVDIDGVNTSGTSMLHEYLEMYNELAGFVEMVRQYDTWDWANIYNDVTPKHLNDLFYLYGRDRFIKNVMDCAEHHYDYYFSDTDNLLIEIEQKKIESYIESILENVLVKDIGRYKVGVAFGEQYTSEACHAIHEHDPDLDLVAMINLKSRKVSYRTQHDDVNVGEFAKYFGGGGRAQTAGSELSDQQVKEILELVFN